MEDYEVTRRDFRLTVPERFNYTIDVVDRWARDEPDKLALVAIHPDGRTATRHTFAEVSRDANRVANYLKGLGVAKGDRVFVQLPRVPEWYSTILGCLKLGAVPMPGTSLLMPRDIQYRVNAAEATLIVTDPVGAARADEVADSCPSLRAKVVVGEGMAGWKSLASGMASASDEPAAVDPTASDDPLLIYFTSGTTGHAKMVLHTHASYGIGHEITARFWHDLGAEDVHWTVSDMGWAKAAWGKLFGQWRMGAAVVMWNVVGKPDVDRMLRIIAEQGITSFCAPPTLYRAFVQLDLEKYDWSMLRHCTSAGEPPNPEVIDTWKRATGHYIYDGYGQTETVNLVANYPCMTVRPGSMGKPAPGFDVHIIDEEGTIQPTGTEGHLAVRTEPRPVGLFREYWRDPERNAESFHHGWYFTGDRAYQDQDGYIWFVGRADDVIISAAYRIGPFEVESALLEHPAVAEAAVVGKPDPERGQIVKAFVILAGDHQASDELATEIQNHVKRVTAPYKYPREIEFVGELPKTISGKIRRVELRESETDGPVS
ncbi:MAG: AMP-binding protein [Gemmatimonadetes bacterium]|nr:AMP-binding protein [Gemmatimonadota bacterium]